MIIALTPLIKIFFRKFAKQKNTTEDNKNNF